MLTQRARCARCSEPRLLRALLRTQGARRGHHAGFEMRNAAHLVIPKELPNAWYTAHTPMPEMVHRKHRRVRGGIGIPLLSGSATCRSSECLRRPSVIVLLLKGECSLLNVTPYLAGLLKRSTRLCLPVFLSSVFCGRASSQPAEQLLTRVFT